MTEKNEMQTLAEAAFFATDAAKGFVGSWKVEEKGWGKGDYDRAISEVQFCLRTIKEAGFKDRPSVTARAPYTHNIQVGCFYKKFPEGERWITLLVATRFGINATFEVHTKEPW